MSTTTEPVATTEAVRLVILAVIVCLQAFDVWSPTDAQNAAIFGLFTAVSVLLSVFARGKSTPTSKVALTVEEAEHLEGVQL